MSRPLSIAVVASSRSVNAQDIVRVCERRSIGCSIYPLAKLTIDSAAMADGAFFAHDIYIFRGYNRSYYQAQALAVYLKSIGKTVIDGTLTGSFIPSKFHEALVYKRAGVAHPRTLSIRDANAVLGLQDLSFPVVVKDVDSQRGKGVRLCGSAEQLRDEIRQYGVSVIVQEFIKMDFDIRVLCIGGSVIGAMKRYIVHNDFRSNVSLGSVVEPHQLTSAQEALARSAHKAMGYDISGVDIGVATDGMPFVIETNITPEWQGFQKATGVDVAERIVDYVIEKVES